MGPTRYACLSEAMLDSIDFRSQTVTTAGEEIGWGVCVAQIQKSNTRDGQALSLQYEDALVLQGHGINITLYILVCTLPFSSACVALGSLLLRLRHSLRHSGLDVFHGHPSYARGSRTVAICPLHVGIWSVV